jgi:hypothetical protein
MNKNNKLAVTAALGFLVAVSTTAIVAQSDDEIPDLSGIWDGGFSVRPVNGVDVPWGEDNFPKLNARALAYQEVWEETMAPKYDCQPAASPAIQYPVARSRAAAL